MNGKTPNSIAEEFSELLLPDLTMWSILLRAHALSLSLFHPENLASNIFLSPWANCEFYNWYLSLLSEHIRALQKPKH